MAGTNPNRSITGPARSVASPPMEPKMNMMPKTFAFWRSGTPSVTTQYQAMAVIREIEKNSAASRNSVNPLASIQSNKGTDQQRNEKTSKLRLRPMRLMTGAAMAWFTNPVTAAKLAIKPI